MDLFNVDVLIFICVLFPSSSSSLTRRVLHMYRASHSTESSSLVYFFFFIFFYCQSVGRAVAVVDIAVRRCCLYTHNRGLYENVLYSWMSFDF